MGAPTSSATIEFPVSLIDGDIRKELEEEGVRFKEDSLELDAPLYDLEVEVEGGIFSLTNGEAKYGEFVELEDLLLKKGIPFDRQSRMDWNRPPVLRVFRPGDNVTMWTNFDRELPQDDEGELSVSVAEVRARLSDPVALKQYLDEHFPTYPPLTDYVKEEGTK